MNFLTKEKYQSSTQTNFGKSLKWFNNKSIGIASVSPLWKIDSPSPFSFPTLTTLIRRATHIHIIVVKFCCHFRGACLGYNPIHQIISFNNLIHENKSYLFLWYYRRSPALKMIPDNLDELKNGLLHISNNRC